MYLQIRQKASIVKLVIEVKIQIAQMMDNWHSIHPGSPLQTLGVIFKMNNWSLLLQNEHQLFKNLFYWTKAFQKITELYFILYVQRKQKHEDDHLVKII